MFSYIFVECKTEKVVAWVVLSKRAIHPKGGRSRVLTKLSKSTDSIGIIDTEENKNWGTHNYYNNIKSSAEKLKDIDIVCYYDRNNKNQILAFPPNFENWFINICKKHGIDLSFYGFSEVESELHEQLKIKPDKLKEILEKLYDQKLFSQITSNIK